ncbi:MAG: tetratricopeptide repeat protein [Gammaproteobacteria bacterium]|nr:tetratricopeptide repeat protein [Gammaproteobacteria bacterium]
MEQNQTKIETQHFKFFWQKYGNAISSIILVVLLIMVGWQYWQRREVKLTTQASAVYESLLVSYANKNDPQTQALANQIIDDYSRTPYATMAAFLLAKQAVEQNQLTVAIDKLQWVVKHTNDPSFKAIAQIRWARVLLADQKITQALDVANAVDAKEFLAEADAIKGDSYVALKQFPQAKAAYQQALAIMPKESALYSYVEMKLNNV